MTRRRDRPAEQRDAESQRRAETIGERYSIAEAARTKDTGGITCGTT